MKSLYLLFMMSAAALQLQPQTSPITGDLFPAEGEFSQLQRVLSEKSFSDPARLNEIENGIKNYSDFINNLNTIMINQKCNVYETLE